MLLLMLASAVTESGQVSEFEQVVADRLAERAVPGERVWLKSGQRQFLGLYMAPPPDAPQRVVILLHGFGGHPDWPEVIQPLRTRLPTLGWGTLSIQLPRLSLQASQADEAEMPKRVWPRIQSATAWLTARGIKPVALVGYGFGAAVGARHLGLHNKEIGAFVAISLQIPSHLAASVNFPKSLETIKAPVLDIYAAGDGAMVLLQAPDRELWGRKNKARAFDRIVIADASAGFHGREDELAGRIVEWLNVNTR